MVAGVTRAKPMTKPMLAALARAQIALNLGHDEHAARCLTDALSGNWDRVKRVGADSSWQIHLLDVVPDSVAFVMAEGERLAINEFTWSRGMRSQAASDWYVWLHGQPTGLYPVDSEGFISSAVEGFFYARSLPNFDLVERAYREGDEI